MTKKETLENTLDEIEDALRGTSVSIIECNHDYMECPICFATKNITYNKGLRNEILSMSSIEHDKDCAYSKIKEALKLVGTL